MTRALFGLAALLALAMAGCAREETKAPEPMDNMGMKGKVTGLSEVQSIGVVTVIDAGSRKVTLSHDPIPEINWSAMTMAFPADPAIDLSSVKVGDNLHFLLKQSEDGKWRLALACRIEGDVDAHKAAMKSMMQGKDEPSMMGLADGAIIPCRE